ncbi:MAG: SpoIIE family protein phosphatase, partial [Aliifodinibius sp.]|nr:serine/threonine-protein phosphatase [Fodinibius sp.]NIV11299.1 SpoIIE family protein phosphatase [Fodinibius sp.]NIY24923.1 SpoIIE family protein phosphatase [Fodinibius sp.]
MDLAAVCKPAYETGGDYYDFVQLDDHRIAVTIGDVSGKGIQAAFYMTFIKGILHSLCREIDSPAEILKKVNRLFYDNAQRGTFISLVYGIIDLKEKTFRFARAGHNPILRVAGDTKKLEELKPAGIGIGLSKDNFDEHLEEVELSIEDNNVLVLYTDGIVEALSESQNFYGTNRLNEMIKSNVHKSASDMLNLLAEDVESFIGKAKQHDDMTIMVMKLNDQKEK